MQPLYKAQFALRLCEKHEKKEIHAYCKICQEKLCSSCVKEEHNSHDWEMITDILREKKQSLPEECKVIRAEKLSSLKKEMDRFEEKIQEQDAYFEDNKSVLNTSRKSYIDEINKLFVERIAENRQKTETTKQVYKDERDGLKQKVEYLEKITISLNEDIHVDTLPDHDILDMEREMKDELKKHSLAKPISIHVLPCLSQGKLMLRLFGT